MSKMKKALAMLLSVILFLSAFSCSTTVFAEEVTKKLEQLEMVENVINNPVVADIASKAEIVFEVEEKRDEYTKVYKKDDGTYTAVLSAVPLHYFDNGEWKEINNSLSIDGKVYSNADNTFNVELPKQIDSDENLTVEKDGYELSFTVDDIVQSSAVVDNNIVEASTNITDGDKAIAQTQSSVTYSDVSENTDLQYIVTPNSIKENIIVSNKESVKDRYTFTFETNGLKAEKFADGSVVFVDDSNEVEFKIPRPVMTDSAQSFSYDIVVDLKYNSDDTVTLKYKPSKVWLNSSERQYPVTIDPAIIVGGEERITWVEDTYVIYDSSGSDTQYENYYNDYMGIVACKNDSDGQYYSEIYTKFNMDELKGLGENIIFTEVQYLFSGYSTEGYAVAKEIVTPINLKTVTFFNKPELADEAIDYYTSPCEDGDEVYNSNAHFNITKIFNEWYRGKKVNNGFAITTDSNEYSGFYFLNGVSPNDATNNYSTIVVMDYVDMGGYNENFEYHTQPVSRAGTGYVNILTQQLAVIRDDIVTNVGGTPITIGMIYDSALCDKLNALNYGSLLAYGNNWTPSFLRAHLVDEEGSVTYYTETGSVIDFIRSTDENGNIIFEERYGESGYELIYHTQAGNLSGNYEITRPDNQIEKFNNLGLLVSITSSNDSDELYNVEYDSQYRIDEITISNDNVIKYYYGNKGLLARVIQSNANGIIKQVLYEYDANNNLTTVTSTDEESKTYICTYKYNANNDITAITYELLNADDSVNSGVRTRYVYDVNNNVSRVVEQIHNGTCFVDGEITDFTKMDLLQTKVSHGTEECKIYQFDNEGKHTFTFDSMGSVIYTENDSQSPMGNLWFRSKLQNCIKNGAFENGIDNWNGSEVSVESAKINNKTVNAARFAGGVNAENTLCQVVGINGKQNDEFIVSGWFKGLFTNSSTNNTTLKNIIEGGNGSELNFTNDRFAQIEVSYQYTKTNEDGSLDTVDEKIVAPFSTNINEWQYVEKSFSLKANCDNIAVCIRYSKNINDAEISCIELAKSGEVNYVEDNDDNDFNNKIQNVSIGANTRLTYSYTNDKLVGLTLYENTIPKTTVTYSYPNLNNSNSYGIIRVNGEDKHHVWYDEHGDVSRVESSDGRITRYIDDITEPFQERDSDVYSIVKITNDIEELDNIYKERIGDNNYYTYLNENKYIMQDILKPTITDSRDFYVSKILEDGKECNNLVLGITSTQDFYGRRDTDDIQLYIPSGDIENDDKEKAVPMAKIRSEYKYDEQANLEKGMCVETLNNVLYSPYEDIPMGNVGYSYVYDDRGNIIEEYNYISENSKALLYSYVYDEQNRLIRYNDNASEQKRSHIYTYDNNGNILSESVYVGASSGTNLDNLAPDFYNEYRYSGNRLVGCKGETITYESNGNPTNINGATLVWNGVNQLYSYTYTDTADNDKEKRILYTYDEDGCVVSKIIQRKASAAEIQNLTEEYIDIEKFQYTWSYGKLINQVYTNYEATIPSKTVIKYVYDSFNCVQGFIVDDTAAYMYLKNIQGDIVAVLDKNSDTVASYEYDVWGVPTITLNSGYQESLSFDIDMLSLAYHGYCYDKDTKMYWVNNRLYNPNWGRFINAGESNSLPESEEVNNVFVYWGNNPVFTYNYDEKEIYYAKAYANYLHNKRVTQQYLVDGNVDYDEDNDGYLDEFIINQHIGWATAYRYGELGTIASGCGWVATYNASQFLDLKLNPEDIIFEYETLGMGLQGFYGFNIVGIAQFFIKKGYDVKFYVNEFDAVAETADVNIMNYICAVRGHFVAIKHDGNQFLGFNTYGDSNSVDGLGITINNPILSDEHGTLIPHIMISINSNKQ